MDRLTLGYFLKNHPFLDNLAAFSSSTDGLNFIMNNEVDIIFLDVEMAGMNGLELLEKVQDKIKYAVFVTSQKEYAVEAYSMGVLDYVLKPYNEIRIEKCISRLKTFLDMKEKALIFDQNMKEGSIIIREGYKKINVNRHEILYLKALKDYTQVVTTNADKKIITMHNNLGLLLTQNTFGNDFLRIHKSYAINQKHIKIINSNSVVLTNEISIPIGAKYKRSLSDI